MKTLKESIDALYSILNVSQVTNVIDGNIYTYKRPLNRKNQDIVITQLPLKGRDIQKGVVHINCYVKDLPEDTPDIDKLHEVGSAVVNTLESYGGKTDFFEFEFVNQDIVPDNEQRSWSYYSIRLNIYQ